MAEQTIPGGPAPGAAATAAAAAASSGFVLFLLAAAQFIMALDISVMNVSIATVASDVGTTVTGIQTAITLYTLVMACLMIVGGKIGSIIGRRRAFSIGCVIYAPARSPRRSRPTSPSSSSAGRFSRASAPR